MASFRTKVFIGHEDELISQKYLSLVDFTTNKIGGKPDWIENKTMANPICPLCGLTLPLIAQIYAPLEKSPYHRTLYLFGCVNPNCWNKNKSWVCVRSQMIDTKAVESGSSENVLESFDWCDGANSWEDGNNGNATEEMRSDHDIGNESLHLQNRMAALNFEECTVDVLPIGSLGSPIAPQPTAEIEDNKDEMVTAETPCEAQTNVAALLYEVKPVPQVPTQPFEFLSFFISVNEEDEAKLSSGVFDQKLDEHLNSVMEKSSIVPNEDSMEKYEKVLPPHGDKLFHQFISRIQKNPGQILRYIREGGSPLFLYPEQKVPQNCKHCNGDLVFELQLLPTIISRLLLVGSGSGHIEFGTVIVLACKSSCWSPEDTIRSEYVVVQHEI